jgi:beta-glucosidase/6-phospho-beta-glucosidase/beta-galactosidase
VILYSKLRHNFYFCQFKLINKIFKLELTSAKITKILLQHRSILTFPKKMKEDVRIMKDTGMDAYRFSISWSRILPSENDQLFELASMPCFAHHLIIRTSEPNDRWKS